MTTVCIQFLASSIIKNHLQNCFNALFLSGSAGGRGGKHYEKLSRDSPFIETTVKEDGTVKIREKKK